MPESSDDKELSHRIMTGPDGDYMVDADTPENKLVLFKSDNIIIIIWM